jgi:hypothetical protein
VTCYGAVAQAQTRDRGFFLAAAAAALVAQVGLAMVGIGYGFGKTAPPAPAGQVVTAADGPAAAEPLRAPVADVDGVVLGATGGIAPTYGLGAALGVPALARSVPLRLRVSRVGIDTDLMVLGQEPDHTVQVPPDEDGSPAGWYGLGATPGEPGPAVVLGHVDSRSGPAVFYNLGAMHAGDQVSVGRDDGSTANFTVDRVARYEKSAFPTRAVYGDVGQATLRLVTCGGRFDRNGGGYSENVIVFATLSSTESADGELTEAPAAQSPDRRWPYRRLSDGRDPQA